MDTRERDGSLTDAQKAAITVARNAYAARVTEREILHGDALYKARSHEEVARLTAELERDRERFARERDRKIAEIRERSRR